MGGREQLLGPQPSWNPTVLVSPTTHTHSCTHTQGTVRHLHTDTHVPTLQRHAYIHTQDTCVHMYNTHLYRLLVTDSQIHRHTDRLTKICKIHMQTSTHRPDNTHKHNSDIHTGPVTGHDAVPPPNSPQSPFLGCQWHPQCPLAFYGHPSQSFLGTLLFPAPPDPLPSCQELPGPCVLSPSMEVPTAPLSIPVKTVLPTCRPPLNFFSWDSQT